MLNELMRTLAIPLELITISAQYAIKIILSVFNTMDFCREAINDLFLFQKFLFLSY